MTTTPTDEAADALREQVKQLVTISEGAEILGMSYQTFYRLVRRGDLPVYKVAGRKMVHRDDLAKLVEFPA
jgi:excisionase family DNA binding protein